MGLPPNCLGEGVGGRDKEELKKDDQRRAEPKTKGKFSREMLNQVDYKRA